MKTTEQEAEETATASKPSNNNNNHQPIELSIVHGATSGIFKVDPDTGSTELADDLSFDQWKEILRLTRTARRKVAVIVADCISYGLKRWGPAKVDEALEQLELEATLVKTARMVSKVPKTLRFEHLDAEHYVELQKADLPRKEAIRWARIASDQRLTATQLRLSIVEGEVVDRSVAQEQRSGVFTVQGLRQTFDIWLRRVGGLDGVKKLSTDHQIEIMEELDAIIEFGVQLSDHLHELEAAERGVTHAVNSDAA